MAGVESAGVDGGIRHSGFPAADLPDGVFHQPSHALLRQEASAGLLQRGEMRQRLETDDLAKLGTVLQQLADAAIVLLLELLEHEAGEQLGLRELFGAVDVRIVAESVLAGGQRDHRHIPWRLAG